MEIQQLLQLAIERKASDLHLITGHFPTLRINGILYPFGTLPLLTKEINEKLILSFLNSEQKENLLANKEVDLGYEYQQTRFRVNVYYAKNAISASFRLIPSKIKTLAELSLPPELGRISEFQSGLVLVTGPTGQGKSSTIAALINEINFKHSRHIVTIEDPIEFVYPPGKSILSQRELHQDTHSWNMALRSVLREDPDVVFVGEIRDFESAQSVLTISETGHLVFTTLHTNSVPETVDRLIDIFPSHQQNQIATQLASVLKAVMTQRLLPRDDQEGRIPAIELLYNSTAVASIIRDKKAFLINNVLQTTEESGSIFFEKYLNKLYGEGKISKDTAYSHAIRPKELEKYLRK